MTTRIGTTHAALEVYNQIYAITPRLYATPRNKQIHECTAWRIHALDACRINIQEARTHTYMHTEINSRQNIALSDNIKTNEGRVQRDLRIRCQNRTGSAHSHVLCTQSAKTSTYKSKRTVTAVQSRPQLLAHIESKHELSATHQ